jgi:uncharacterized protein YifN (PemK superfamily)
MCATFCEASLVAIKFIPQGGDVLWCEFGPDPLDLGTYPVTAGPVSVAPEMVKKRRVLVVSSGGSLVRVAPFSTRPPQNPRPYHHRIPADSYPFFRPGVDSWLKADVLMAVSRDRLDRLHFNGRFQRAALSQTDWLASRTAVLEALGLGRLKTHL